MMRNSVEIIGSHLNCPIRMPLSVLHYKYSDRDWPIQTMQVDNFESWLKHSNLPCILLSRPRIPHDASAPDSAQVVVDRRWRSRCGSDACFWIRLLRLSALRVCHSPLPPSLQSNRTNSCHDWAILSRGTLEWKRIHTFRQGLETE